MKAGMNVVLRCVSLFPPQLLTSSKGLGSEVPSALRTGLLLIPCRSSQIDLGVRPVPGVSNDRCVAGEAVTA